MRTSQMAAENCLEQTGTRVLEFADLERASLQAYPKAIAMHLAKILIAAFALVLAAPAYAQATFPTRPVKVMHGFAAGGPPDVVLRQIAARLEKALGVAVIVENRPGASGTLAAAAVSRAEPDGYTLLFGVAANLAVAPAMMKTPPYAANRFAPIIEVARGPYVWLVRSDAPAASMTEFVTWARSRPGRLNYASPGVGSVHHFATEMLKEAAGIDIVHIPFTGGLYTALLGGQVDAMFESLPGPLPHLASGKLRALGVTGPKRLAALPGVPTLAEQGIPGIDVESWWGFVGPAGLPAPIVTRLNLEIGRILGEAETQTTLSRLGIEASPGTSEAFGAFIALEEARWRAVVRRSGLRME